MDDALAVEESPVIAAVIAIAIAAILVVVFLNIMIPPSRCAYRVVLSFVYLTEVEEKSTKKIKIFLRI